MILLSFICFWYHYRTLATSIILQMRDLKVRTGSSLFKLWLNGSVMSFVFLCYVHGTVWAWNVLLLIAPLQQLPCFPGGKLPPLLWHHTVFWVLTYSVYVDAVNGLSLCHQCLLIGQRTSIICHLLFALPHQSFSLTPAPFKCLGNVSGISYETHMIQEFGREFQERDHIWISFHEIFLMATSC